MAYFNTTFFSSTLCMMTDVAVVIPDNGVKRLANGDYPVLFLLHGLSDNHTAWSRRTKLDLYAEETGIAIVMPEVQRGFYQNMDHGLPYFDYIAKELPELCHQFFRTTLDPAYTYVAGLSMGGYGAMRCALTYPERYAKAACTSAVTDLCRFFADNPCGMGKGEMTSILGDGVKEEEDLFKLATSGKTFPPLYQVCGESDFLIEENRRFHKHLEDCGVAHMYEEWAGAHEWRFWDTAIEKFLRFFAE